MRSILLACVICVSGCAMREKPVPIEESAALGQAVAGYLLPQMPPASVRLDLKCDGPDCSGIESALRQAGYGIEQSGVSVKITVHRGESSALVTVARDGESASLLFERGSGLPQSDYAWTVRHL